MGTNYYWHAEPPCSECGRPHEKLHIGKSSGGWAFALHVIPERGINSLDNWRTLWAKEGSYIRNEYGDKVSVADMEHTVTKRTWHTGELLRATIDYRHCIAHGDGTWDHILGDFS